MNIPRNKTGPEHPKARLTQVQADLIREQFAAGISKSQLAHEYGVDRRTIFRIVWWQSYDLD